MTLKGKRILITRPASQAGDLAAGLKTLGAEVYSLPAIKIVPPKSYRPLDLAADKILAYSAGGLGRRNPPYDWILFTSANTVRIFMSRLQKRGAAANGRGPLIQGIKTCAIGPATSAAIKEFGEPVTKMAREFRAESMAPALGPLRGKKILLPRASKARDALPKLLKKRGARVEILEAYRTRAESASKGKIRALMLRRGIDWVTFTSSSTVEHFMSFFSAGERKSLFLRTRGASIGPITSRTLKSFGVVPAVEAKPYTAKALLDAIRRYENRPPGLS